MLTELIGLLEGNSGEFSIQELAREVGAHPSAVAGMLEILIRKGRLIEVGSACGLCETCAAQVHCALPVKRAKRFEVLPRNKNVDGAWRNESL